MELLSLVVIFICAFSQNAANSMVSRSRNRDNKTYHVVCSILSNGIFYLTFHQLVMADMALSFMPPYLLGTTMGSLFGAEISMRIERAIGAKT